jgi:regulator of sigma E protease
MDLQWLAIVPILSILMLVHELGHFITARRAGIVVQEFGFGLPPRIWGYEYKGVIYSLNWIPFGAFVKMLGEEDPTSEGSFASKSKLTRSIVLAAGSAMNFLLAVIVFAFAYMSGWPTPVAVEIAEVSADSPAQAAGMQAGDIVVAVDGTTVTRIDEFQRLVRERTGGQVGLQLRRGDQTIQTTMTPRVDPPPGQGAIGVKIAARTQPVPHNPLVSLGLGFERAVSVIGFTLAAPWMVIQGSMPGEMLRPIGLPGMAQVTSQAVEATRQSGYLYPLLVMTGTFSAGLAIANMLPIPALDGGRLFFIFIEAIRGRRVSPERESLVHFVGIVVLIALMILIAVNDIQNPFGTVDFGIR